MRENPATWRCSRSGCAATGPRSCSTTDGALRPSSRALAPKGDRRMSANPHANGGAPARPRAARLPRLRRRRDEAGPGGDGRADHAGLGSFLRDVIARNPDNFRLFGPGRDRLEPARRRVRGDRPRMDAPSDRCRPTTTSRPTGRVMEVLSEHLCQGWLEGYLLTGRHGLFNCYEAFIHIVDSMFNQHAKWLKVTREIPWRRPIASLNYLLSRTSGGRTTTASRTRTPASSTTSSTRRPRSSASTCRRTPTRCCRSPTTACAAATT